MAAVDLTTTANVKGFLQISDSGADTLIDRLVTAASIFFIGLIDRKALKQTAGIVETHSGIGSSRIFLKEYPVTAVASVKVDGSTIPVSSGPTVSGFAFDQRSVFLRGYEFTEGAGNVEVTYTAGHASGANELLLAEQAVIEIVAQQYKRRAHSDEASKSLGQQVVTFTQRDVPNEVRAVVDLLKRVA